MQLPGPIRAAVGLAATAVSEARHLPDRAVELPMLAVSTALQASLRLQQRYAALTVRGDEILNRSRAGDDAPAWATFDDDPFPGAVPRGSTAARTSAQSASELIGSLFGTDEPASTPPADGSVAAPVQPRTTRKTAPAPRPATKAAKRVSTPRNTAPSKFDIVEDPSTSDIVEDPSTPDIVEDPSTPDADGPGSDTVSDS